MTTWFARWSRRGGAWRAEEGRGAPGPVDGLRGRRFIVTGGGGGIGKAVAAAVGDAGASVMLVDENPAALRAATADLARRGYTVASCVASVDVGADVDRAVEATVSELGGIDGLVTSAGNSLPALALDCSREAFDRVVAVHLTGTFLCSTAVARHLVARGTPGAIVTIASTLAFSGEWMHSSYAASKAGVIALTKNLALEWGMHGIRVNCVAPGLIDTPINADVAEEDTAAYVQRAPLGRSGVPDDVAKVVRFLLSGDAGYVTGQTIAVNGGHTMPS